MTKFTWTEEIKETVTAEYVGRMEEFEEADRPKFSSEVVKELAQELTEQHGTNVTPNGVMMVLSRAGVYISKAPAKSKAKGGAATRKSKADSHADLISAIQSFNAPVDEAIIEKLTGKEADYITSVLLQIQENI